MLPKGFPFDRGQEWLTKVEFGKVAEKRSQEYQSQNQYAQKIGFDSFDEAKKLAELAKWVKKNGKSLDELIAQFKPDMNKLTPAFPTRDVSDYERRQERLTEQLNYAQEKKYEPLERSVRTTEGTIDKATWLRNQYTNEAGQMICQICKLEMPFRKRDGEYYFEAVEALSKEDFPREHEPQHLALCPLCAAMYKEFVKKDLDAIQIFKNALLNSDELEVSLQLGDLNTSIRFVESHFIDMKTILKIEGD